MTGYTPTTEFASVSPSTFTQRSTLSYVGITGTIVFILLVNIFEPNAITPEIYSLDNTSYVNRHQVLFNVTIAKISYKNNNTT